MKLKTMMVALFAALMFASCSEDEENGGGQETVTGEASRVGIIFSVPKSIGGVSSRANIAASTDESTVDNLSVYIFNATGTGIAGNNTFLTTGSDFSYNGTDGVYELNNPIASIAVKADIYVIVNHPDFTSAPSYSTKSQLIAAIEEISAMSVDGEFTMVASTEGEQLKEYDASDPTTTTQVTMSAGRVVSKVVATSMNETYQTEWKDANSLTYNTLTYTITEFNVYQEAIKSYLVAQYQTLSPFDTSAFSPYATSVEKANKAVEVDVDYTIANPDELNAIDRFYIGENTPTSGNTLNENTTYVMIATKVKMTHFAKWNSITQSVGWEDVTGYTYTEDDDLYVVNYNGMSYVTNTEADAIEIAQELGTTSTALTYYTYPEGYVHFQVFLNGLNQTNTADKNSYSVDRNQLIHVKVTGLIDKNSYFPGYPGGDGDGTPGNPGPDKPIDPNEDNGKNPDPKKPGEKVDPEDSLLDILIEILGWEYAENEVELS